MQNQFMFRICIQTYLLFREILIQFSGNTFYADK